MSVRLSIGLFVCSFVWSYLLTIFRKAFQFYGALPPHPRIIHIHFEGTPPDPRSADADDGYNEYYLRIHLIHPPSGGQWAEPPI